jgi:hypothetical protein
VTFKGQWYRDKLAKKRQKGLRGYPVATVAYYGPDDRRASKVSVGVIPEEDAEVSQLERWTSDATDVRRDDSINEAIFRFIEASGAKSVVGVDRIIGCPHEEGVDYPEGQDCPMCPFWAGRDRWSGVKQ